MHLCTYVQHDFSYILGKMHKRQFEGLRVRISAAILPGKGSEEGHSNEDQTV